MPIPSTIDDLSTNPSSNSPSGSDSPTEGDNYLRAIQAIIKQEHDYLGTASTATAGAGRVGYDAAISYTDGLGQFLNYTFGRTADEIAASVTPTNYAYFPGDPRRYGAVGDGTTTDDTAFANWALVIAGKTGFIPNPSTAYKLTTGILIAANTTIRGAGKARAIVYWYGSGPCFRSVGTVNTSGALRQDWSGFKIVCKGNASPQDGIALLWGGANLLDRIWITWDGSNRPRYCVIADQVALLQVTNCHFDDFSGAGIIGPNTGEYTTYGTSTSSYVTAARISGNQFNTDATGAIGIALDIGENVVIDGANNFNAIPTMIRLGNITAATIAGNYFERTSGFYNASTNHGPAVLFANTSTIAGAALTVTNRTQASFGPDNHIEIYQNNLGDATPDNDGVVEIEGGFAGTLNIVANQFVQQRSHCVHVISGTVSRIVFDRSNYFLLGSNRSGLYMDVFVAVGASASIFREDAWRSESPSSITIHGFGGQRIAWCSAAPTGTAGSALESETFSAGDVIYRTNGSAIYHVQTAGTFGAAQASSCTTVSGSNDVTLSGSDGVLVEGCQITITGVTGTKTIKQIYLAAADGLRHLILDSNCDSSGSGRTIAFVTPTYRTV